MTTIKQVCVGVAIAGAVAGAGSAVGTAVASAAPSASDSTSNAGPASPGPQSQAASRSHAARSPGAAAVKAQSAATRTSARPAASATAAARAAKATASVPLAATSVPAPPRRALIPVLPLSPTPAVPVAPASAVTTSTSAANLRTRANAAAAAALLSSPPPTPTHVLLIGTDGTNLDKILADPYYATGGFKTIMDQGITSATSIVGHTTISGPSWTTILTGVWDTKSGVINNLFNPKPYDSWPTVINQLEYSYGNYVDTSVIADWQYINDIGAAGGWKADNNTFVPFTNSWAATDAQVASDTVGLIHSTVVGSSSFIFSYQVQVDEAGHAYGGGSPEYAQAVTNVSNNIDDIMTEVNQWNALHPTEEWTVIVTTDHGHQQSKGFGHGFQSPNETSSFVIFDQAGDDTNDGKQNLGYSNTDITPTIVSLFGITPLRSDFDGVPLTNKNSSNVKPTDLVQALNDAIDMYGYPNIGDDLALGTRTIFASIPYFLDGFVTDITAQLQGIVDKNIFLISALAGVAKALVQITGDIGVAATQVVARVVAHLTGSGTIAPTDPPLPPPAAGTPSPAQLLLLPAAAVA